MNNEMEASLGLKRNLFNCYIIRRKYNIIIWPTMVVLFK